MTPSGKIGYESRSVGPGALGRKGIELNTVKHNKGWIQAINPILQAPSLKDNTADVDRLLRGVRRCLDSAPVHADLSLIRRIPAILRKEAYRVRTVVARQGTGWRLVDVLPEEKGPPLCGVAVDLGTSTVVIRLVDLDSGQVLGESGFVNPQIEYGKDILTRIHFASQSGGLETLRDVLLDRLNQEIRNIISIQGIPVRRVVGASLAGNTTMTHLFLGLNPFWICREPYIPAVNRFDPLRASQAGLAIHDEAPVLVFPNVGSYFGGDLIAGILASGMDRSESTAILVDVGTNAEVVLGNRDWLMACAGAAGPALEGGVARMGMMAGPGVIERVRLDPRSGRFDIRTIEGKPPLGICGSGLIDLAAQLFLSGMIDMRGKCVSEACGDRLVDQDGVRALIVVPASETGTGEPLTLSQPDLDALMRSKAAMYTILTTVTGMVGTALRDLERFYVAGTFGAYIDPRSAVILGMLPDLPLERYVSLGNTSLEGAAAALLDAEALPRMDRIRERITYIELNVNQEFMNLFSAARFIPHTDRTLFPSVTGWQRAFREEAGAG